MDLILIDDDVKITINLNKLVEARAKLQSQYGDYSREICKGEYLDGIDIDRISSKLRDTLSWDALYTMVDDAVLDYLGIKHNHYGEIQPEPGREAYLNQIEKNKKEFKMVDLVSPAWTIQVPMRKK